MKNILFLSLLLFSCQKSLSKSQSSHSDNFAGFADDVAAPLANEFNENQNDSNNDFINDLKLALPTVKEGMSTVEVNQHLGLDKRFNGIVTSEGKRNAFKYYYDLKDYELILVFNYVNKPLGAFTRYELLFRGKIS